jgi:hypothetical protein
MPTYVKLVLTNEFPRSQLTTHLGRAPALYCGPFRSRASAERFESQFLDLFQMRRCQEDLHPFPEHPGCIYGEMGMCLRPCQQVVGRDEYLHEVGRVEEFLKTGGHSLLDTIERARGRYSEETMFEEAARQHKRYEKVQEVIKLRDELARDIGRLHGIAITPSAAPGAVELWIVREGHWQAPRRLSFEIQEGKPVSLDGRLRDILGAPHASTRYARAPGVPGIARALVLFELARRRMAAHRGLRKPALPETGARHFARGPWSRRPGLRGPSRARFSAVVKSNTIPFRCGAI